LILLTVFELLPKTCNFTICSIFSNSGHVGWCMASPDTILKLDTLVMIQTKFGLTWPLLLKIEHMVKLQVFGNNSKTVSNIKNLTWSKNDQHIKIYLPCNFEVNLITHLGVIALFSSNL
jgi:hypothetical protein